MNGFIKIPRSIVFDKDGELVLFFLRLVAMASIKDDDDHRRGEVVTSIRKLAKSQGISFQKCRTLLMKLEERNLITQFSTQLATHLTICDFASYQGRATHQATQSATHNIKEGNIEEKENRYYVSIKEKQQQFAKEAEKYIPEFGKEKVIAFISYWAEPNKQGLLRYELQPTWSTRSRLNRFKQ